MTGLVLHERSLWGCGPVLTTGAKDCEGVTVKLSFRRCDAMEPDMSRGADKSLARP